ncbi:MAG: diguanylate cyclase, partial [Herminiimonas sp.]|nr:diguanylate cyclase [Herminiimonas sp.]
MKNAQPGSDSSIATDQASSSQQNQPSPDQEVERDADTSETVVTGTDTDTDAAVLSARERAVAAKEMVIRSREETANLRDDVAQSREKTGDLRDDAVLAREITVDQLEVDAASREKRIDEAESMTAVHKNHLEGLRQANEHLVISSVQALTMTEAAEKATVEMADIAHHDFLTGLPNRLLLAERIIQSIALAKRHDKRLAVLFVDLDRFKTINDSLGHTVGDSLLKTVAQRLQASVRGTDTVSRQGGDEFIILLSEVNDEQAVGSFVDKLCKSIGAPFTLGDQVLHIGASVGISMYPEDGEGPEALIHNADAAMYHAKHGGRGRFEFFKSEMTARAIERLQTEASLYVALDKREFELYYQAQVALETGKIIGSEALIRWRHPARGLLVAGAFVPIAEACGAIIPMGRWVLREACRQTQAWLATGLPRHIVSVNISATEFGSADFLGNVKAVLHDTGLAPEYLELELTETVL